MKTISKLIQETYTDGKLDTSVKTSERKQVYNALYDKLDETKVTGHLYRDNNWEGVTLVTKQCKEALKALSKKMKSKDGYKYEISIAPDDGGYRKSKDGMSQWKQYKVEVYKVPEEYEDYPEPFIIGTLNCHAAGSLEDPFEAYDMSFCISY